MEWAQRSGAIGSLPWVIAVGLILGSACGDDGAAPSVDSAGSAGADVGTGGVDAGSSGASAMGGLEAGGMASGTGGRSDGSGGSDDVPGGASPGGAAGAPASGGADGGPMAGAAGARGGAGGQPPVQEGSWTVGTPVPAGIALVSHSLATSTFACEFDANGLRLDVSAPSTGLACQNTDRLKLALLGVTPGFVGKVDVMNPAGGAFAMGRGTFDVTSGIPTSLCASTASPTNWNLCVVESSLTMGLQTVTVDCGGNGTSLQGSVTFNPNSCTGLPSSFAGCSGTATCAQLTPTQCAAVSGCEGVVQCAPHSQEECAAFTMASDCTAAIPCEWNGTSCSQGFSETACVAVCEAGCSSVELCASGAGECSGLDELTCVATAGCAPQ